MSTLTRNRKMLVFPALIVILSLALSSCGPIASAALPLTDQVEALAQKVEDQAGELSNISQALADTETSAAARLTPEPAVPSSSQSADASEAMAAVEAYQGALMNVYEKVNPSVVNIQVLVDASTISQEIPFGTPDDGTTPENPSPYAGGMGSGFVWDQNGHIVTNNHVVAEAQKITVVFPDGSSADAELVGADPDSDLAVIKVNVPADQLRPVTVADSDTVRVGQLAIAIGNPFGLDGTMTVGIVSALNRTLPTGDGTGPSFSIPNIIQTDAPINPGNSGGVLVDANGNLIGVTTAIESPVRASAGIGFVVPSNIVRQVVPVLIDQGSYQHSWLGISGGTLVPEIAKAMGLDESTRGVIIGDVVEGGPAANAGLLGSTQDAEIDGMPVKVGGDVITAIDGTPVNEMEDLINFLSSQTSVGQTVTMTVLRDSAETSVPVTLAARPAQTQAVQPQEFQAPQPNQPEEQAPQGQQQPGQSRPRLGIVGMDLNSALAEALKMDAQTGVLVIEVAAGSPAEQAGLLGGTDEIVVDGQTILAGGDVIVAIDGTNIETVEQLRSLLGEYVPNAVITLTILRDGQQQDVEVQLGQ